MSNHYISDCCNEQVDEIRKETGRCLKCLNKCGLKTVIDTVYSCGMPQSSPIPHKHDQTEREKMIIEAKKIPAVSHREIFMKTCDMMYSHYNILGIVDIATALAIIKGTLKKSNETK